MGTLLDDLSGIHHQNDVGDSLGRLEDRERMVHGLVMVALRVAPETDRSNQRKSTKQLRY